MQIYKHVKIPNCLSHQVIKIKFEFRIKIRVEYLILYLEKWITEKNDNNYCNYQLYFLFLERTLLLF